jgi:hypothetical protein
MTTDVSALVPSVGPVDDSAFYQVAAEAIPLLFIALLLQMNYFTVDGKDPQGSLFVLSLVVFAGVGEAISLGALADDGEPSTIEQSAVIFAITALFLPLLVRAALPLVRNVEGSPGAPRTILRVASAVFLVGATVLTLTFPHAFGPFLAIFALVFFFVANLVGFRAHQEAEDSNDDDGS